MVITGLNIEWQPQQQSPGLLFVIKFIASEIKLKQYPALSDIPTRKFFIAIEILELHFENVFSGFVQTFTFI